MYLNKKELSQAKEIIQKWKDSPITRHYSFSDKKLWSKQEEVLWSVRNNARTCVKSGNTVGKSFISADVVLDYLTIYQPAKVITTAPTWTQVEEILWKEIASNYHTAKIPIGGELLKTELKLGDDWFAMGLSTNEVNRFQGFHSPHLLVVVDEAMGVPPEIWEAIEGLHPHRILAIGNPLDSTGDFYNCFSSPLYNKITISCYDAIKWQEENGKIPGLVTREWIEERREDWGDKSTLFQSRVLGEFPSEGIDTLVSRKWVEDARKRKNEEDSEEDGPRVIAFDVATKHGTNETVKCYRYAHTIKAMQGWLGIPITETADRAKQGYAIDRPQSLVIDSDGIGEGVGDILTRYKVPHVEFHGGYGAKAIDSNKFKNLRSQFYWIVAKKFEKGVYDLSQLDDKSYELLKNQLCAIKAKPPDAMGRIQVETKEDMMARGVMSPDYADAFVYGEYGFWVSRYEELRPYAYR